MFAGGKSADTYTYIAKSLYLTIVELSDLSKASDVFVKTTQSMKYKFKLYTYILVICFINNFINKIYSNWYYKYIKEKNIINSINI